LEDQRILAEEHLRKARKEMEEFERQSGEMTDEAKKEYERLKGLHDQAERNVKHLSKTKTSEE